MKKCMLSTQGQAKQSSEPFQCQEEGNSNANVRGKAEVANIEAGLASKQIIISINPGKARGG